MKGTDIFYISGPRGAAIGYGLIYPDDLTADSVPNVDEWGPDNYWGPQAYIDWFTLNEQQYGLATAQSKMFQAVDQWSGWGGIEIDYAYQDHFRDFFASKGIDTSTWAINVVDDLGNVLSAPASIASSLASILKIAIPTAAVLGIIWIARSDEPKRYVKRKLKF